MRRPRVRRWILAAVLLPLAGRAAEQAAGRMETKRGVTPTSRRLRNGAALLRGSRGYRRF